MPNFNALLVLSFPPSHGNLPKATDLNRPFLKVQSYRQVLVLQELRIRLEVPRVPPRLLFTGRNRCEAA